MALFTVCGNLTKKKIKIHNSTEGKEYVTFTLCDNPYKKNKDSKVQGEMVAYKVICWDEFAQMMKKEAKPGRQFTVKGILSPRTWVKDGKEYEGMEIKANDIKPGRLPNSLKQENEPMGDAA